MLRPGDVLIVSCYELGHQPLAAATALAALERAGFRPAAVDLAVEPHPPERYARARFVGLAVPMHTALRVGIAAARRIRRENPHAHICFLGTYAWLNAETLFDGDADSVIGAEFELPLVRLVESLAARVGRGSASDRDAARDAGAALRGVRLRHDSGPHPPALEPPDFVVPARSALPPLERYARLDWRGERHLAGAVETTRGCLHRCRHCPLPAVYGGRLVVVPREVVLADVGNLVDAGARHVTFADADFLNGPTHARKIVREIHHRWPELTFDFTAKIEHLLRHRRMLAELADAGALFVVSAVESLSDLVLERLRKGHTRRDVFRTLELTRTAGIVLRPSLLPFTPWSTLADYGELLDWIEREGLVRQVDAVQLSIRLLVPPGSLLETLPEMRPHLRGSDPSLLGHAWIHPDPRMDALHAAVSEITAEGARDDRAPEDTFHAVRRELDRVADGTDTVRTAPVARGSAAPPRLTEPWFC